MKRRNVMKFVSVFLIMALLGMSLMGCSDKSKEDGNTSVADSKSDDKIDNSGDANSILNPLGELPIVKEPVTLKIFAPANGEYSIADNLQTKEIEEKTGIKIEWQVAASSDNIKTKISTIFASGDMPDIIFTGAGSSNRFDKASEQRIGEQGLVIPLNQYLDNDSVGYKSAFEKAEGLREYITTPGGNIYSLPSLDGSLHVQYNMKMWINEEWLNNLGLEMPETSEEYEAVLRAFKEQDANGNGDPNDEIPFSTVTSGGGVQIDGFLMAPYQLTPAEDKLYLEDGKVTYAPITDGYKEGLKWLNKMYEEGLIYPESFTQDKNTQININEAGDDTIIGSFVAMRPGYAADLSTYPDNSRKWEEYKPLAPLEGPDGTKQAAWDPYVQFQTGMVFITQSCEQPEIAFRLLDYLATEEMAMRSAVGVEGEDWRPAVEGEFGLDGQPAKYTKIETNKTNSNWGQMACLIRTEEIINSMTVEQDPYGEGVRPLDGRQVLLYSASLDQQKYSQSFESVLPDLYMSEEDSAEMSLIKTTINDTQKQLMSLFIIGSMDIDEDWDDYTNQLNSVGLDRYLELIQNAYDSSIYAK